jgi:hypothetical protein
MAHPYGEVPLEYAVYTQGQNLNVNGVCIVNFSAAAVTVNYTNGKGASAVAILQPGQLLPVKVQQIASSTTAGTNVIQVGVHQY